MLTGADRDGQARTSLEKQIGRLRSLPSPDADWTELRNAYEATAERWCDAWEIEATGLALPRDAAYWTAGAEWIAAERAARRPGWF